jgi:hypothetical protein
MTKLLHYSQAQNCAGMQKMGVLWCGTDSCNAQSATDSCFLNDFSVSWLVLYVATRKLLHELLLR